MDARPSSEVNISDVIEVIETDEMYAGAPPNNGETDSRRPRAYVKIIEQPASKALRFRYECEGRSAGSIPGVSSTPENKTYPGIQIVGYHGRAVVVVSCVTKDAPYRPHPHNLVGKEGCNRGVCTLKMSSDTITFSNLGIQCVKKKDIEEALKAREELRVDPFRTGFSHKNQPSSIDLNSVRLCFQVFLEGPVKDEFTLPLRPIVSDPIYDKKAMSDLTICKLSDCSASVAGGKEIILLCEKVAKEDIQIRFYEEREGEVYWEALGDFQPTHVHKQVAISFRTPKYKNIDVEKPVKVWVQLRRPSDGAVSESIPFQFVPLDSGRATFWSLRKVLSKKGDYNTFSKILNENVFLSPEMQKKKLESLTPLVVDEFSEREKAGAIAAASAADFENQKDALISGGNLVVIPKQDARPDDRKKEVSLSNISSKEGMEVSDSPLINDSQNVYLKSQEISGKELDKVTGLDKKMEEFFVAGEGNGEVRRGSNENSQSFNDLITQVAELDEIYAETRERLILTNSELENQLDDITMDCRDDQSFRDNQTYSSLQLAMKNPVNPVESRAYEDVPVVQGPLIDIGKPKVTRRSIIEDEKLPPLPPKRVKKTPPRRPDDSPLLKSLPKTPDHMKAKQNIFQRLFSKNKPSNNSKMKTSRSSESLKLLSRDPSTSPTFGETGRNLSEGKEAKNSDKAFSKWFHRASTGSLIDNATGGTSLESGIGKENVDAERIKGGVEGLLETKDDLELGLDLTEAENYALYTTLAPHASMTELDEISFYYSPVEKGKILTQYEPVSKVRDVDLSSKNMGRNPAILRRKRQKYGGESSPQNILRPPQDDDSRSTFVGSVSPDRGYHMLQVKREPSETSPVSFVYGGNVSPMYPGASPGPPSPNRTPPPVPYTYSNVNLLRHNAGGGLIEVKPNENNPFKADLTFPSGAPKSETSGISFQNIFPPNNPGNDISDSALFVEQSRLAGPNGAGKVMDCSAGGGSADVRIRDNLSKIENDSNRSQIPETAGNTMLDMDSQQYSLELNLGNLDSAELTRMAMMTDANLSENLSSNLTLDDKVSKSTMECDQSNMTDSFTRVANNVIQELVSLSDMNQSAQQ